MPTNERPLDVLVCMPHLYDTSPGQRFRIEQWARLIDPREARFHFAPFSSRSLHKILYTPGHYGKKAGHLLLNSVRRALGLAASISKIDVIYIHRELLPVGPALLERLLSILPVPVVYDFDDAIFLPSASEANARFAWLKSPDKVGTICRLSSHITVGNDFLADYARRFSSNVSVIPTTIDTAVYVPKPATPERIPPVIGWSGSTTTVEYLRTVGEALTSLARMTPFRMKVMGARFELPGMAVESTQWSAESELACLRSFDIGIMPMRDEPWARGKCGLKALQYMALGIPTVASPFGVNAEIIEDGKNGFLASSQEEWIKKLSLLLHDENLRKRLGEAARRTVEKSFSGESQAPRLLEILKMVANSRQTQRQVSRHG